MAETERTDDQKILDAMRDALKALHTIAQRDYTANQQEYPAEQRVAAAKYLLDNADTISDRLHRQAKKAGG